MIPNMGDSKRWTVTYTKHLKQKRKVYQDGALEHHGNKVMLFDDTDKLIDSRFMKKDEVVECGGTLTFDGYLVDIGDPEGNHGVLKDLNVQGMDKSLRSEKISNSHESKRFDAGNNGAPQYRLNPVKNIKKEDEKNEFQQFGAPRSHLRFNVTKTTERGNKQYTLQKNEAVQSHSNSPQSSAREWQALYTTQITQKAKKYHDGILRIEFRGSHQKQVMLYDASRNLLNSRFLKKDEVVDSGETVVFDAHLVDVGDPEAGPHDRKVEPSRHGNAVVGAGAGLVKSSADKKYVDLANTEERLFPKEKAEERIDNSNLMQDDIREWHAMYTTQVTQKAKKYHDGFLQLTFCVSQRKQVILLSDDRTVLSKKYLNSSADVRVGSTLQLTNYLVEIGELHIVQGGEPQTDASSGKHVGSYSSSLTDKIRFSTSDTRNKPIHASVGEPQNDASSRKHAGSSSSSLTVEEIKFSASDSRNKPTHDCDKMNKPIRDVLQILSTLRKPMAPPESLAPTRKPSLEQICPSQSSDSFHFGLKEKSFGQNAQEPKVSNLSALDCHNDSPINANGDCDTQMRSHRSEISQSRAAQNLPTFGIINLMDPDHNEELQSDKIRSSGSLGAARPATSNIPTSKSHLSWPGKSTGIPYSSISESQASDVVIPDLPDKRTLNTYSSAAAEHQESVVVVLDLPNERTTKSCSSISECQVSNVLVLNSPEDTQPQETSMKYNGLMEISQITESHFFRSSEGSSCNKSRTSKHVQDNDSNQTCLVKMETGTRREEGSCSALSSSSGSASLYFYDATEKGNLETLKDTPKEMENIDEYPTFDLGI